jgi:hypothetical protein
MASAQNRDFVADFRRRYEAWEAGRRSQLPAEAFEACARGLYQVLGWMADELEGRQREES